jgi:hypothetical protein
MMRLAKEYGLSDNGLRKICRRFNIPIPQGGYWQKLQYGKRVQKVALPAFDGEDKIEIQERVRAFGSDKDALPPEIAFEYMPENLVKVSEKLSNLHPLVKSTKNNMHQSWKNRDVVFGASNTLNIRTQRKNLDRALRIMDALIKALEKRKLEVFVNKDSKTCVKIFGETLEFRLYETEEKVKKEKKGPFDFDYELVPTGKFILLIESVWDLRSKWRDLGKQKMEDVLNSFIIGLYQAAFKEREWRLKRETEARAREEEVRRTEEIRIRKEQELKKIRDLENGAVNWQKSQIIRGYIEAVKKAHIEKNGEVQAGSEFERWLNWAGQQVDRLDSVEKRLDHTGVANKRVQ